MNIVKYEPALLITRDALTPQWKKSHTRTPMSNILCLPCNFHSTAHAKRNTIFCTQLCRPHMNENSSTKVNAIHIRPVSCLRGTQIFTLCPIVLNYVQQIFPGGEKISRASRPLRPPYLRT